MFFLGLSGGIERAKGKFTTVNIGLMATQSPPAKLVIKKAFPALILILFIFISLMFLISYTDAFFLVILAWILVPVLIVKISRWFKSKLAGKP